MNEYYYPYTKSRREFGKHCNFSDSETKIISVVDSVPDIRNSFVNQDPQKFVADNIPHKSEHSVNTDRVKTKQQGMCHTEGGWPKEITATEFQETSKWRKRIEKDPNVADAVKTLCNDATVFLRQNNTIDLYEEFFQDDQQSPNLVEDISVRTVAVFRDQNEDQSRRTATTVCWSPESDKAQVATAYSVLKFQHPGASTMAKASYVWNMAAPNKPMKELLGPSSIVSLQYNQKSSDLILGGMYNGLVSLFDVRRASSAPVAISKVDTSHKDPVYSVCWLHSKTNSEFVSCSTDGRISWWDTRMLAEGPIETNYLYENSGMTKNSNTDAGTLSTGERFLGATCLEWVQEAGPTKYLVGAENGVTFALSKKPKRPMDVTTRFGQDSGHHHGPVYTVKRNPMQPKFFLTVGDWSARIFAEDNLRTPIITSYYHQAQLQTGCWSPTRAGLFMVGRKDGVVDFWDYFYRQHEVAFSHKVSDSAIWSLGFRNDGRLLAAGDADGKVTVMDLCPSLYQTFANNVEKNAVGAIFEREMRREKNLEQARRHAEGKAAKLAATKAKTSDDSGEGAGNKQIGSLLSDDVLSQIEADFFRLVGRENPNQQHQQTNNVTSNPELQQAESEEVAPTQ